MIDYALILSVEFADREWSLTGNDPATLVFHDGGPVVAVNELDGLWPSVRDAAAWGAIRVERDRLLTASDWTQVADAPVDAAAWAVYRQALRDIPQDFTTPDEVVWPTPPA